MVRLLHTADWQLGKQFENFDADLPALLRTQRIEAVRRIAALAQKESVDAVLVAGDCFEGQLVSQSTLIGAVEALKGFSGDWVLLPGNHDHGGPGSIWERFRLLVSGMDNIHLALDRQSVTLADGRLVVLPAPLQRRHETEDLTAAWDNLDTPAHACRVGLAHGAVQGILPEAAESNNPIAPDRAATARLDYLALGDWHGTFQVSDRAWYSGTPEPDRFKDNDPGNVLLVDIAEPGTTPVVRPLPIGHYHWRQIEALLHSAGDIAALGASLQALEPKPNHVLRLTLDGSLSAEDRIAFNNHSVTWRGQFAGCDLDVRNLATSLSERDFEPLQPPGFVNGVVKDLQSRAAAGESHAQGALETLYRHCAAAVRPA